MTESVTGTSRAEMAEERGISRRDLLRRAAVVGGTVVWLAPAIQTIAPKAYADVSPGASHCCQCRKTGGSPSAPTHRCFANDPTADTLAECEAKCSPNFMGGQYTIDDFHQDFPAGSGKSFSCVPATSPQTGTVCSPVPH
jgi:hypothetical protein